MKTYLALTHLLLNSDGQLNSNHQEEALLTSPSFDVWAQWVNAFATIFCPMKWVNDSFSHLWSKSSQKQSSVSLVHSALQQITECMGYSTVPAMVLKICLEEPVTSQPTFPVPQRRFAKKWEFWDASCLQWARMHQCNYYICLLSKILWWIIANNAIKWLLSVSCSLMPTWLLFEPHSPRLHHNLSI